MESAFGILANHSQVLLTTMQHSPDTVKIVVKGLCCPGLQNQQLDRPENANRDFIPGAWRQDRNLEDTHTVADSNTANKKGKKVKESTETLCEFSSRCTPLARYDDLEDCE